MIGVQAQYRLVEQQVVHVQRQPDDQLVDGAVARGQRADLLARVQAERLGMPGGRLRVEALVEAAHLVEQHIHAQVLGIHLLVVHAVQLGQGSRVVGGGLVVHEDAAARGNQAVRDEAEQRRLSRPVASEQRMDLPVLEGQRHVVERLRLAERLRHMVDAYLTHGRILSPPGRRPAVSSGRASSPRRQALARTARRTRFGAWRAPSRRLPSARTCPSPFSCR